MADAAFLEWCQQHGVTTHSVQPGFVAEGWRGILAAHHIQAGTEVMSVPQQLLMSVMSARRDMQLSLLLQHHQLNSNQVLVTHLLHEASKAAASFWQPYLQQLPRHFTTLMAWPRQALQQLQLPHAQQAAAAAAEKARGEWLGARAALQELGLAKKWCSWSAWCWAASCVLSRTMYHPDDPPCGCLTPLGDLHNYAPPPAPYTPDVVEAARQLAAQQLQRQRRPQQQQPQQAGMQHLGQQHGSPGLADGAAAAGAGGLQEVGALLKAVAVCDGRAQRDDGDAVAQLGSANAGHQEERQETQPQDKRQETQPHQLRRPGVQHRQGDQQQHGCNSACCNCHAHGGNCSSVAAGQTAAGGAAAAMEEACSSEAAAVGGDVAAVHGGGAPRAAAAAEAEAARAAAAAAAAGTTCAGRASGAADAGDTTAAADAAGVTAGGATDMHAAADASEVADAAGAALCGDGYYDAAAGAYKIVARRSYAPGEQLFLCYGRHPNLDLLELYGFLLHDNPHETALLPVHLLQQALQQVQQQAQQQLQGERQWRRQRQQQQQPRQGHAVALDVLAADCYVYGSGQPSWQLLQALRLATAARAESKACSHLAFCGEPLSPSSERLALRALQAACQTQLAGLATTLAEDEALLASPTTGSPATAAGSSADGCGSTSSVLAAEAAAAAPAADQRPVQQAAATGDRQQQEAECVELAVAWRVCYKRALSRCIQLCESALSLLAVCDAERVAQHTAAVTT